MNWSWIQIPGWCRLEMCRSLTMLVVLQAGQIFANFQLFYNLKKETQLTSVADPDPPTTAKNWLIWAKAKLGPAGCSLNIVFFPRLFQFLLFCDLSLNRHRAAIGCEENGQPKRVTCTLLLSYMQWIAKKNTIFNEHPLPTLFLLSYIY